MPNRNRSHFILVAMIVAWAGLGLVMWLLMTACGGQCETEITRCDGNAVEICNADGDWDVVMDCSEVWSADGAEWQCCIDPDDGEATCFPEECSP